MLGDAAPCSGYFLSFEKTFKRIERFILTSYERNVRNEYKIQRTGMLGNCVAIIIFHPLGGAGEPKETRGSR